MEQAPESSRDAHDRREALRSVSPSSVPLNGSSYAYGAAISGLRVARRVAVGVIGTTVVAIGVAMLVLPGPGLVVIPAGLGILGLEFAFARRWLKNLRERATTVANRMSSSVSSTPRSDPPRKDDTRRD
jgi:hypothetical protein